MYSNEWLLNLQERPALHFFYGHAPDPDRPVGDWCFSQWWVAPFVVNEREYLTAEHWMMAEKARLFDDADVLEHILKAPGPAMAKALGRKVRNFDAARWDAYKQDAVLRGNVHKFSQHRNLGQYLKDTGDDVLVEASPTDTIWGIGLSRNSARAQDPRSWRGQNLLGYALMSVRDKL